MAAAPDVVAYLTSPDFVLLANVAPEMVEGTLAAELYHDADFWRGAAAALLDRLRQLEQANE